MLSDSDANIHSLILEWSDIDEVRDRALQLYSRVPLTGVYGVPRGGLPLAVILSHALAVPMLQEPTFGMLWIDDIVDKGNTFSRMRLRFQFEPAFAWVTRWPRQNLESVLTVTDGAWVVFPWENRSQAEQEAKNYELSRK